MKNLILCFVVLVVGLLGACGTENVCDCLESTCDCPEDEKLDFFVEYYSTCLTACQLAVQVLHDCDVVDVTISGCVNQFWNNGMTNNNCVSTLSCYQVARDLDNCDWTQTLVDTVPAFKSGCSNLSY